MRYARDPIRELYVLHEAEVNCPSLRVQIENEMKMLHNFELCSTTDTIISLTIFITKQLIKLTIQ